MGENSNIEWTDHTWNPWMGCQKVSQGCKNCYMFREMRMYGKEPTLIARSKSTFDKPLRWAKRYPDSRVFACSWSDFFIPGADAWRPAAWDVIRSTPELHYLILTKRPELAAARLPEDWGAGWPHVWLGVSIEDQAAADFRLPQLLKLPAQHRFLSIEPLLELVDLIGAKYTTAANDRGFIWTIPPPLLGIQWMIVGGETGQGARPCHPDWVRSLRDLCVDGAIPFFFNGWGDLMPLEVFKGWGDLMPLEADPALAADGHGSSVQYLPVGKRQAGRMLDGREWLELPAELQR